MARSRLNPEFQWLAGYLEGEGCFTTMTAHGRQYGRVIARSIDRDVLDRVVRVSGLGKVMGENCNRTSTRDLYPLLCARRQARVAEVLLIDGRVSL